MNTLYLFTILNYFDKTIFAINIPKYSFTGITN